MAKAEQVEHATRRVLDEYHRAAEHFTGFRSDHEGYAVILEEMDELWEEIKRNPRYKEKVRDEAIQVAAMALRFLVDLCEFE